MLMGRACEVLLPIRVDFVMGNPDSHRAVCTLSSIELLKRLAEPPDRDKFARIGRLVTENRGVEKMIDYLDGHHNIRCLILCGRDSRGHLPGQALIALHNSGVDEKGRIIGALGADPVVNLSKQTLDWYRNHVRIENLIGVLDPHLVIERALSL